jgi:hypothetical protein
MLSVAYQVLRYRAYIAAGNRLDDTLPRPPLCDKNAPARLGYDLVSIIPELSRRFNSL